jgi:DNA-binding IclR family transcriptional regulator
VGHGDGGGELRGLRRRWRRELVAALYDEAGASVTEFVPAYEVAARLDVPADEARKLVAYLEEKGWVYVDDHRLGIVRMTAAGIDAVESGD